jgi:hypothetical protein
VLRDQVAVAGVRLEQLEAEALAFTFVFSLHASKWRAHTRSVVVAI